MAGDHKAAVRLTFRHALTAVRFVCGDDVQAGTIKRVTLRNVYSKGDYDLNLERWSGWGTKASFSQTLDKAAVANQPITTEAQTFMMLPQTLPDDAEIEVVFNDGTADQTLKAPIGGSGKVWPKGKTVTYKISTSSVDWEYFLDVTAPEAFTYAGGTNTYSVKSYRKSNTGKIEPVAWKAQFSEDGTTWSDTAPDWLTEFTASGVGGDAATTYKATVKAQVGITNNPHTKILREERPVKGTEAKPYNLSNSTGGDPVENTANCYVVDAPGWYSFPLVYGNAIKNGQTNESAYTSTATGDHILNPFINHLGNGITDPYIDRNVGCDPAKAELVWQDALLLVTDIRYNPGADGGNISFKVDKERIQQGNAVIAIKDNKGNVMWSWHIWVTDEDINKSIEVTNHDGYKYRFTTINLGWCEGDTTDYPERSCQVRFNSVGAAKDKMVKQLAQTIRTGGNNPNYRHGRKDPSYPPAGIGTLNKVRYTMDGSPSEANPQVERFPNGTAKIKNQTLKPATYDSSSGEYYNLWDTNWRGGDWPRKDHRLVKSVYDPCPEGTHIPISVVFSGFTLTGGFAFSSSEVNGVWNDICRGWNFYSGPNRTGEQIFFPCQVLLADGRFLILGGRESGSYHVADAYDKYSSLHHFSFSSSGVTMAASVYSSCMSIRPVREK